MRLRPVREDEAARLREIRLACLAADPDAFTSTRADEAARSEGWWTRWSTLSAAGVDQATFVVTDDRDVNLCVMLGNDAALRLYEAAGFSEESRSPHTLSMTRGLR